MVKDEQKVVVFYANAENLNNDKIFQHIYKLSSSERKRKTDAYSLRKDKNLSLCAEYLLMNACREFNVNYVNEQIVIKLNEKPIFKNSDINFNLSHSENMAMCIMSNYEVGCDVEIIGKYNMGVAKKHFSIEEIELLSNCATEEEKNKMFFTIWTLKESVAKCVGKGLQIHFNSFSVVYNNKVAETIQLNNNTYFLYVLDVNKLYCCAICLEMKNLNVTNYNQIKETILIDNKSDALLNCFKF